ncbi:MAG: carbohydrate-binding domain-containing protein [Ruminococcus sp.]|nr:carbohydrate-binding domain-containing protein [Ruminococcus sp.]
MMKMIRNWMCLLAVLGMMGSLAACGTQKETDSAPDSTVLSAANDDAEEDLLEEDSAVGDDAPIVEDELVIKGKETTAPDSKAESKADTTTAATGNTTVSRTDSSQADVNSAPVQNVTQNSSADPVSSAAPTSSAAATEAPTQAPTEPPTEATTQAPENVVSGVINLNNGAVAYEGEGISVNGNVITITGEGDYVVSGNLPDGMIEVNTTLKVKLKLNGVSISNSTGPAILVNDAKRLTITLIEGSSNVLQGGSVENDGAICTNDTLEIKGAGSLYVNGTVEHGIASDDDVVIKNGNIQVDAVKTGIMANDDITVSGGSLRVTGGTNGMKSKGTLNITGGTIWTKGGKETKSALYSLGAFTLTGGYVYAMGCGATAPEPTFSTQCAAIVTLTPSIAAGGSTEIVSNGVQLFADSSPFAYNTVFVSTPEMYDGMPFTVYGNGADMGSFTTAGLVTSVTAGS